MDQFCLSEKKIQDDDDETADYTGHDADDENDDDAGEEDAKSDDEQEDGEAGEEDDDKSDDEQPTDNDLRFIDDTGLSSGGEDNVDFVHYYYPDDAGRSKLFRCASLKRPVAPDSDNDIYGGAASDSSDEEIFDDDYIAQRVKLAKFDRYNRSDYGPDVAKTESQTTIDLTGDSDDD